MSDLMTPAEKWLLDRVVKAAGNPSIKIWLQSAAISSVDSDNTVILRDRKILARLAMDPEIAFGDGYASGAIEVRGDLVRFLETIYTSIARAGPGIWYSKAAARLLQWGQANTVARSRRNIHQHYDLNHDFYRLWLDPACVYTCAYFPTPAASLHDAQIAKMDYVCRKLALRPGETVIEAGCGWGALAIHMAQRYGVSVRAFNISHEQIAFARRRAANEGLRDRVEFIEDDYRNISGRCDAFVSIGMLEHVGVRHYRHLGNVVARSLANSGRGLVHFIGRSYPAPLSRWIRKRIFPGAYPPTLREALQLFEPRKLSLWDVENLRPHYARTLEHWLDRFEQSSEKIGAMYGPEFVRAWRLYLAGSLAAFRTGSMELFQVVFGAPEWRPTHWTRAPLYETQTDENAQCIPAMS
jgi:cyclopropane-fatty-acyl-phospholipid synthase